MSKIKENMVDYDDLPDDFEAWMAVLDADEQYIEEYQEDDGNSNCDGGGCTI
jgi:hypothetical protein